MAVIGASDRCVGWQILQFKNPQKPDSQKLKKSDSCSLKTGVFVPSVTRFNAFLDTFAETKKVSFRRSDYVQKEIFAKTLHSMMTPHTLMDMTTATQTLSHTETTEILEALRAQILSGNPEPMVTIEIPVGATNCQDVKNSFTGAQRDPIWKKVFGETRREMKKFAQEKAEGTPERHRTEGVLVNAHAWDFNQRKLRNRDEKNPEFVTYELRPGLAAILWTLQKFPNRIVTLRTTQQGWGHEKSARFYPAKGNHRPPKSVMTDEEYIQWRLSQD